MYNLEGQDYRRNNLRFLTVAPALPIPISSDILFKRNIITQLPRSRSPSIHLVEELSSENLLKLENFISDRISLISNDSVSSASETEKITQPIEQEKICLQLSDWLIQTMEEYKWREITMGIDFEVEVDPELFLPRGYDELNARSSAELSFPSEYFQEEGNSIFYANSNTDCSQFPSTSRVYDVAVEHSKSPSLLSANFQEKSNKSSVSIEGLNIRGAGVMQRANSMQDLICALAESSIYQNLNQRAKLIRTFNTPELLMPRRNWKPPGKKFIFEISKPRDFVTQLASQKHRCAGCGLKLDKAYAKRAHYCHYYSKLFCQCCHQGSKSRIPARILHEWNFKEYPVCDIALKFLSENEDQPVFNVRLINPDLYKKARNLQKFRKLRTKISHMWPFVQTCKMSTQLMTEHGFLRTMFTSVPKRFLALESVDVFSLLDFERIANRNMIELLEPLAYIGSAHIEGCERCRQHAFLCQICMDANALLFPFQVERCHRCDGCGSLTHMKCYNKVGKQSDEMEIRCGKCERLRRKKFCLQRPTPPDRSEVESE